MASNIHSSSWQLSAEGRKVFPLVNIENNAIFSSEILANLMELVTKMECAGMDRGSFRTYYRTTYMAHEAILGCESFGMIGQVLTKTKHSGYKLMF